MPIKVMRDLFSNEVHHVNLGGLDDLLDLCRRLSSIDELVVVLPGSEEIFKAREEKRNSNKQPGQRKTCINLNLLIFDVSQFSITLLDEYELPVCGQMRVVSWSWIRHGPGTPGNNFAQN